MRKHISINFDMSLISFMIVFLYIYTHWNINFCHCWNKKYCCTFYRSYIKMSQSVKERFICPWHEVGLSCLHRVKPLLTYLFIHSFILLGSFQQWIIHIRQWYLITVVCRDPTPYKLNFWCTYPMLKTRLMEVIEETTAFLIGLTPTLTNKQNMSNLDF